MCCSQQLSLSFTAYFEKEFNWNVIIKVEHKATDLRVNVKALGYAISCQLTCEDPTANDKQIMSATAVNDINLGRVFSSHIFLIMICVCLYVRGLSRPVFSAITNITSTKRLRSSS